MNAVKLAFLAAACMLLCNALGAQTRAYGSVGGFVSIPDRNLIAPVNGATVILVAQGDTLKATVVNGRYSFKKVPVGKARLEAAYVGYKTTRGEVDVKANSNTFYNIILEDAPTEIAAVTVKGRVPAMSRSGDTLVYNAGAVGTLEGDYAEEILKQMPGVTLQDGKITVMGKNVARVYVDGKMLFGEGTMTALQNLKASDVIKFRSYDEDTEANIRNRQKNAEKRRVIDIETKSKLTSAITGDVLISYGADINQGPDGKHQPRYALGATLNYFTEKLNVTLDANTGNTGRTSNRTRDMLSCMAEGSNYLRNNVISFNVRRNFEKKDFAPKDSLMQRFKIDKNLFLDYTYEDSYTRSQGFTTADYFPVTGPDGYVSRINYDTTRNVNKASSHAFVINYMNPFKGFVASGNGKLWDRSADNYHGGRTMLDGVTTLRTSSDDRSSSDGYDFGAFLGATIPENINIGLNFRFSQNDGNGWKVDSLPAATNPQWLTNSLGGYTRNISPQINKIFSFINKETELLSLDISYQFAYDKSLSKRMAIDQLAGRVDPLNTYDYVSDQNTHDAALRGMYRRGNKFMAIGSAGIVSTGMNRNETLPVQYDYSKRFNSLKASMMIMYGDPFGESLDLHYNTSAMTPSIDQLRNQLDDSNPMAVRVGNPGLDQSITHMIGLEASSMNSAKGSEMQLALNFSVTQNSIVSKTLFFPQQETLPGWNYTMQPGSTLSTYENVGGSARVGATFNYSKFVKPLKGNLNANLSFNYAKSPSYINNQLDDTKSYNPTLVVGLNGTVNRRLSYRMYSNSTYNYAENSAGETNKTFQQTLHTELNWDITDWFFLNLTYNYRKLFAYSQFGRDDQSQVMNAMAGFKLFNRKYDVSLAAYDILNKDSNFSSTMTADYVTNSWRQTYGRYLLVNVAWRINASKSQR